MVLTKYFHLLVNFYQLEQPILVNGILDINKMACQDLSKSLQLVMAAAVEEGKSKCLLLVGCGGWIMIKMIPFISLVLYHA